MNDAGGSRSTPPRCGVVGIGGLGRAFALRLRAAGFGVVVSDSDGNAEAWARDEGLAVAGTPRELAASADVVLLAVPDTAQILEALEGADGLEPGLRRGSTVVITSTVAPETPLAIGQRLAPLGVRVVDAPVSGGPDAAAAGTLAIMVGADEAGFAAARSVLETLGTTVVHVGPPGHGELAKLVNNLMGATIAVAAADGLVLAAAAGLDVERVCEAIGAGSGGSWILQHWLPVTALRGDYRRRFGVDLMCKDLGLIAGLADRVGVESPALELARATFEEARRDGHGADDFSVVVARAAARAGIRAFGADPAPRR